jgi:predicted metal-dependent HD superfamily phosphohydrolase
MGDGLATFRQRWWELAASFPACEAQAADELRLLEQAYCDGGRHYHGIGHIVALLALSREHRGALEDPAAVDLAIFYHDAVYRASRNDNEAASAALARERLTLLGVPVPLVEKVARYVEATRHEAPSLATGRDCDLDHLIDFDLSILAAPADAYDAYAAAIRSEYSIYPDLLYRPGRAKVLRAMLAMPVLYRVPELRARWEGLARANIERELTRLGG